MSVKKQKYLIVGEKSALEAAEICADWLMENQDKLSWAVTSSHPLSCFPFVIVNAGYKLMALRMFENTEKYRSFLRAGLELDLDSACEIHGFFRVSGEKY